MRGVFSIDKPHKICDICSNAAIYNVKTTYSRDDLGYSPNLVEPLSPVQLKYFMKKTATLRVLSRKERGKVNVNRIHNLAWSCGKSKEERQIVSTISSMYEHVLIFTQMLRKLKTVNEKAYYRRLKSRNELLKQRNSKPKSYPTCYYVCSEECLNMLVLQKS